MEHKDRIIGGLLGKSTVERRKAAKLASANGVNVCKELIESFSIESNSSSWQTKLEIIKAMGDLKCNSASDLVRGIVYGDGDHDIVKLHAAKAYIRIARNSLSDIEPVREVVELLGYSTTEGALEAIGYDRMVFSDEHCAYLIKLCWDFGKNRPQGYTDPRYGLAAACAGWSRSLCLDFLHYCLESNDTPLCYVAKKSIVGEYCKLR